MQENFAYDDKKKNINVHGSSFCTDHQLVQAIQTDMPVKMAHKAFECECQPPTGRDTRIKQSNLGVSG